MNFALWPFGLRMIVTACLALGPFFAQADPIDIPNWNFEVPRADYSNGLPDGLDVYLAPAVHDWYQYDVNVNGGTVRYWNPGDPSNTNAIGQARWADTGFGGNAPEGMHVGYTVTRYNDDRFPDGTSGSVGDYVRDFEALCQVLEEALFDPDQQYTLTVMVGNPPGNPSDPDHGAKEYAWNGYMVQLLAGGEEVDQGSSYAPTVFKANGGTVIAQDSNSVAIAANTFELVTVTYTPGDLTEQQAAELEGLPLQIRLCALEGPDHSVLSIAAFDSVTLDVQQAPPQLLVLDIIRSGTNAADFALQWNSQSGTLYRVFTTTDLAGNWTAVELGTNIPATPPTNTFGIVSGDSQRFYKIDGTEPAPRPLVEIEMVTVGDPGNAGDTGGTVGAGGVPYTYEIGKYEVTYDEYCRFLNAVDPNGLNALALYHIAMGNFVNGGISFSAGNADGQKYTVKSGMQNKPVIYVSFYNAMRFCNWLHNGAQPGGDTENGAYALTGNSAVPSNGLSVVRNVGAEFAVPTEDEWYKAAYYDPVSAGADANSNSNYWLYPTMSDSAPTAEAPPGGSNSANYNSGVGTFTDVGAYTNSPSHFGTFDQAGNAFEWNETRSFLHRKLRGGSWGTDEDGPRSDGEFSDAPDSTGGFGFRVSSP